MSRKTISRYEQSLVRADDELWFRTENPKAFAYLQKRKLEMKNK